jgi:hypothetical protein
LGREWGAARDWNTVEQVEEGVKEALEKMIELFNVTVQLKSRVHVKERGGDNVGGTFKARDVWYQQSSQLLVPLAYARPHPPATSSEDFMHLH